MNDPIHRRVWASAPRAHLAILAALMTAHVACGAWASVASSDTSRDVFFAQQIASGQSFPLTGPAINGILHLGPLWYYLLALPLLLFSNAAVVTGTMGLLSATQFPLAYALGGRLRTRDEGLLFALCLALPGWVTTSFGSLTHPVMVIPSLLLASLAALAYRQRPDAARAAGLGLALALMCTAHPTLVLPALLLLAWCAVRVPDATRFVAHAGIIVVLVAIPLLPMLYEQWITGFHDVSATASYTRDAWTLPSPLAALELVHAIVAYGPQYVTRYWLDLSPTATAALFALYAMVVAIATIGLVAAAWHDAARRRIALVLIGVLLLHATFLCAVRDTMPPWMIYSLWLLLAALMAIGLGWFLDRRAWRAIIGLLLAATTLWTVAVLAKLMQGETAFTNMRASPGKHGFFDVRDYEPDSTETVRFARIPFRQLFALGEDLCEPVTLYGHLAYLVDSTYAVGAAHSCGTTGHLQFGGMPAPSREAWAGLHATAWHAIGMSPQRWNGPIGLRAPEAVWHSPNPLLPVVPTFTNFPRPASAAEQPFAVEGDAPAGRAVLVSHRALRYKSFRVARAFAGGREVAPRYFDLTTSIFVPPEDLSSGPIHWRIEIEANADFVDVLTLAPAASR
jgi:hypothetical protein